jgi:hypothetical protein
MSTRGRRVTKVRLVRQRPRLPSLPSESSSSSSSSPTSSDSGGSQAPERTVAFGALPAPPAPPQLPEKAASQVPDGDRLPPQVTPEHPRYADGAGMEFVGEAAPAGSGQSESSRASDTGPVNLSRPLRARISNSRRGSHNHHSSQTRRRP